MQIEHENGANPNELRCAVCDNHPVVAEHDDVVICPNCDESYSLIRHEEFTMIETDGWIARISVGLTPDSIPSVANG